MNALAGGGSFVSLPTLIAVGVPSVQANASSKVALWPGGLAGAWTYYDGMRPICAAPAWPMLWVTLASSLLGSLLLLVTPARAFDVLLPWLLLLATLALAFGRRIGTALHGRLRQRAAPVLAAQFAVGVYGGYFGGAVGLMMVAVWSVMGEPDIKALNAPRTLLVSTANTVAVLTFALAGAVRWLPTLAMLTGGIIGGAAGARLGRRVPARLTRVATVFCTAAITAAFFAKTYFHGL